MDLSHIDHITTGLAVAADAIRALMQKEADNG